MHSEKNMSDAKLCRICVRKDVKLYEHNRFQLMVYYKEVTGSEISSRDRLPKWFCYECAALLYKFHAFKKKCHSGQAVFKRLRMTGCANIDSRTEVPEMSTLRPHLQLLSTSKNNSVKTYTAYHSVINSKKHSNNKKYNFTKIFVDDVRDENSKVSKVVAISTVEDVTEANVQLSDELNNDSNDSIPLVSIKDTERVKETSVQHEFHNTHNEDLTTNIIYQNLVPFKDIESKNTVVDASYTERTISVIKSTNSNKELDSVIKRNFQSTDFDKTDFIHHQEKVDPNTDNKFQRSVKKKFLDGNHWTKITLSDEEAARRFQAKALEQKYLKADFKCADCYRTFSQEDMMKRHIKLRHCESLGPNECRHCRMRFKWRSRLHKHLKEHYTIYKCLRCELSFPVEISAFQHDYSHNGVIWTCAHCGQRFKHSSTYYTHLRKHKSKYVCPLCGVSFVSEFGLFMHKRVKHVINEDTKEESLNTYCKVCDIKFDNAKGYEEHFAESALHATEVLDGATCLPLKTKCTRKRVPRVSTNCTTCGKTFSTYAAFCKHHLAVHPELVLPRSATDKHDGRRQMCEICGLTLASSWSLLNHLNTHSRDRRYTCNTCGVQLSTRSVLQRHQMTHSAVKSFVCDKCHKRFSHRSGLRAHLNTHDKELRGSPIRTRKKMESQNIMEYFKSHGSLPNNYT